jgi:ketosteroid isomerase-like protein
MKMEALFVAFLPLLVLYSFAQSSVQSPFAANADEAALLKAEADFEHARAEKGAEGWLSFFAEDATDLAPGAAITGGKEAMQQRLKAHWNPNLELKWQPAKVHVAKSRDLGYTLGEWQLFDKSKPGSPVVATGKYVTVWQKQKDKSWKAVADIGNQNPPSDSSKP